MKEVLKMLRRGRLPAYAGGLILAGCVFTACQIEAGPPLAGSPAPEASGAAANTAGTPSAGALGCSPEAPSCLGLLAAGTHRTSSLITPFSYTVPEGWDKTLDVPGSFNLERPSEFSAFLAVWPDFIVASQEACTKEPEPGVGRTAADLVAWLSAHPGLDTTEPARVTVGGLKGQSLDVRKNPDWNSGPCPQAVNLFTHTGTIDDIGWEYIDDQLAMNLAILDSGADHIVTIAQVAPRTQIDAFAAATDPIIASFDFSP